MRVVSWNVNSIRAREERARAWLERWKPEVLCLQETKVVDDDFPFALFEELGYQAESFGQRGYNGVAIASRLPVSDVVRGLPDDAPDADRRLIAATVEGLRIVNVYVPNGQHVTSEKYDFKLEWLSRLRTFLDSTAQPSDDLVICGDFNVAPDDRDVHDPRLWRGKVLFSEPEHRALGQLMEFGLEDVYRRFHEEAGHFSWWDYRMLGFPKNRGLRIDLFLGTRSAANRCTEMLIDREERKGAKPSDHAPVHAVFA